MSAGNPGQKVYVYAVFSSLIETNLFQKLQGFLLAGHNRVSFGVSVKRVHEARGDHGRSRCSRAILQPRQPQDTKLLTRTSHY